MFKVQDALTRARLFFNQNLEAEKFEYDLLILFCINTRVFFFVEVQIHLSSQIRDFQ